MATKPNAALKPMASHIDTYRACRKHLIQTRKRNADVSVFIKHFTNARQSLWVEVIKRGRALDTLGNKLLECCQPEAGSVVERRKNLDKLKESLRRKKEIMNFLEQKDKDLYNDLMQDKDACAQVGKYIDNMALSVIEKHFLMAPPGDVDDHASEKEREQPGISYDSVKLFRAAIRAVDLLDPRGKRTSPFLASLMLAHNDDDILLAVQKHTKLPLPIRAKNPIITTHPSVHQTPSATLSPSGPVRRNVRGRAGKERAI
ncbi:hypothetical protein BT69DRAFT_1354675 [Atractiella rhizophila]|nr:hypothetical protein BT69DRAFT_1354675 [Atractiella rhizophila]